MKRIRLITASYGNDETVLTIKAPVAYKDYIIDQVFYNNINTKSRINSLHPRMKGKIPKMMEWYEHPEYDYYIWIDSKFTILDGFIENMLEHEDDSDADISLFKHPQRDSTKAEMNYMVDRMKNGSQYLNSRYEGEILEEQVNKYLADENFIDNQLFYCGCFAYSKKLVEYKNYNVLTDWIFHCMLYHTQDQLWFPYLLYKHKVNYKTYSNPLIGNTFLKYIY